MRTIGYEVTMQKCCGQDRTTPFCPTCGKALGNMSPLVELLKYLRGRIKLKYHDAKQTKWISTPAAKKATKEIAEINKWIEALEVAIASDPNPKVCADWLMENNFPEAAAALRGMQ